MRPRAANNSNKVLLRKISGWMMTSGGVLTMLISIALFILTIIFLQATIQEIPDPDDPPGPSEDALWLQACFLYVFAGFLISIVTFMASIIVTITGGLMIRGRGRGFVLVVTIFGSLASFAGMNTTLRSMVIDMNTGILFPLLFFLFFTILWGFFLFSVLWSLETFKGNKTRKISQRRIHSFEPYGLRKPESE